MTTPMRQQYLQIKRAYPDTIVFFRLGDFYETFDGDARLVAEVCDITLTSRPVGKNTRVPLAGVPHHTLETYVAKLIAAGHKVAIVEQSDDTASKGLMAREVTDVITPGTVLEPALLDAKRNNYLAAVVMSGEQIGVAYVDITTGEFATTQTSHADPLAAIRRELDRLQPAECLLPDGDLTLAALAEEANGSAIRFSRFDAWRFELENARQALLAQLGAQTLDGYGCGHLPLAIQAAGAIVQYLAETRRSALAQLTALTTYSLESFMVLDASTRRNLELTQTIRDGRSEGALLGVLDRTMTPMGGRLLRRWLNQPLLQVEAINTRLDAVAALHDATAERSALRAALRPLGDLERLVSRAAQRIANPRDLLQLCAALRGIPALAERLSAVSGTTDALRAIAADLDPCEAVVALLSQALQEDAPATASAGGIIAPGFAPELDQIRAAAHHAKEWIAALEETERQRTGIKSLKVGYNKVFGYYIEVTQAQTARVPDDYIRKQTLVNAERYITPELKDKETLILNAQERLAELEARIYAEIVEQVASHAPRMLRTARAAAALDVYAALAEVAAANRYVRPVVTPEGPIDIRGGRHPVVELRLGPGAFVPNDIAITDQERILVITGPNMAGKSTILRQVALIVLMAQIGSFVPADAATIGLADRIYTRVGAQDDISAGQSTFMVEMVEVANILNNATPRSLLILDEVGRGTSTYDGISIAWAMVEYLHNHPRLQARTLFATHYHELCELANLLPHVRNYNVAVAEEGDRVVFLHRLAPGCADRSYGVHVARLAGLPRPVLRRAEEILQDLEQDTTRGTVRPHRFVRVQQLPLLSAQHPVLDELDKLDVMSMSPLEALTKLYELQEKARKER